MERIASFCVDHTKLDPGIYISRVDGDITTYDVRMKKPNKGNYLAVPAMHTIEHLLATYVRNSALKDNVIYAGPMGCRTGFYLLLRSTEHLQAITLIQDTFAFIAAFTGDIPGASEVECGNYREQDLPGAKAEAAAYLPIIQNYKENMLYYAQ